jgi:ABC-type nitrate/sulfonate/bicarbonate transport system substrate-binding protein
VAAPSLRIGFVPLTDVAPVLMADALGLFAQHGVRVTISREASWAALRDKLAFGALDGAHLLGPLAIALATGAAGIRRRVTVTAGLARNGNTITLSHGLAARIGAFEAPLGASAFAAAVHARAEEGLPPPTLAVVYPFSSHNYLLRHWLAQGGLDPDHDIRLVAVPPPQMARALADGAIEGFCAGEPWGSHAVAIGVGRLALMTGDIWRDHPEKVLAFAEGVAEREPEAVLAATAAVAEAARWLEDPANRCAAAALLHERGFPSVPPATLALALEGKVAAPPGGSATVLAAPMRFESASCPQTDEAGWWFDAMRRWGHLPAAATRAEGIAPWRPDLWRQATARLSPPYAEGRASAPPAQPITEEKNA